MKLVRVSVLAVTLLLLFEGAASADSVLIVGSDPPKWFPRAELLARGFSAVGCFDSTSSTPTLATMSSYDAVLAFTDYRPEDPTALGNLLADYADTGRRVVLSAFAFSWSNMQGRIMTAGYSPLTNLGIRGGDIGVLTATVPTDPIFNGVVVSKVVYYHNGSNSAQPGLDSGATLLATEAGVNMIARNTAGNVIGMNMFPEVDFGNNGEFYNLLANALRSPSPAPVPLPRAVWAGIPLLGAIGVTRTVRRRTGKTRQL